MALISGNFMSSFAYLSQGKLHLKLGDAPVRVVDSKFGLSVRQRAQEIQQRHSWKTQGRGAQFMRGGGFLWGMNEADPGQMPISINGLSRGCNDGELVYSLDTPEIAGVFMLSEAGQKETRLWHTADYRVSHVSASADQKRIACVVRNQNGTSTIASMREDGSDLTELTAGDCIEMSPRWIPGSPGELIFQSAGMARDEAGMPRGRGAFSIQRLNIERGELTTVAEDPKADLLGPQMSADGALYYIRRPYEGPMAKVSIARATLDLLLFPFRLLFALFQYLNFFTMMYTGKTLTSAGNAQREADVNRMMVWGNLIDARKAARQSSGETPALVPKSWDLVRQSPDGTVKSIAQGVLSFDVCPDGSVLYSNGSGVFRVSADGKSERLAKDAMIEQVVAL